MHTKEDFSLISQVAVNTILNIPIQNHSNTTAKFKFPISPPPPNKIQDERKIINIFQDMLGILSDTPKLSYKYYIDLLLKRDSGLPEIDTNGVELSTSLIRQAIKDFEPKLTQMKNDYLNSINKDVVSQHIQLSLPGSEAIPQGPLMFVKASVPESGLPSHYFPLLADCGATNSCLSLDTFRLLGYTTEQLCTEVQYSLSNVTEQENPNTIIGSIFLDIEIQCKKGLSILSVHFLVLDSNIQYGILGALELQNTQAIICLACMNISSFVYNENRFQWTTLTTYETQDLNVEFTKKCTHTSLNEKSKKITKAIERMQSKFDKSVNSMNISDMQFNKTPQNEMPPLHSENATDAYLDDMNEEVEIPDDVDINTLDFNLDGDFKSLDQEIRALLKLHSNLHPRHKNDVGQFPNYRAILTPAPNSSFTQKRMVGSSVITPKVRRTN